MSINRALPSLRADVAAIYAARDHAALVAIYTRLVGDFNPEDYADPDLPPGSDLRDETDMREHLLDYMRECCHEAGVHVVDAGIRSEDAPAVSVRKAGPGPCPTCPHPGARGLHCRICWPRQYR